MIKIGEYNTLKILRETSVGLFLGDEDQDVLLPNKYCPENFEIDQEIEVFCYLDYAERLIATNIIPKITLHTFAFLKVKDVADVGAFLDWNLEKDLMVPFREQRQKMVKNRWYVVFLDIDKKTDRLYASNKLDKFLQNDDLTVKVNDKVDLLVYSKTDLGYSVIVNNEHKGLVYANQVFTDLHVGDSLTGFVSKIREENKLDISLQPIGYENFNDINSELIYNALVSNKGFLSVNDKSSPDEIKLRFNISKKAFKKATGNLYKLKKITFQDDGIKLIND